MPRRLRKLPATRLPGGWGKVTPFVLRRSSQFRPGAPYHLGSKKYSADFNEVKSLGGDGVTTPSERTEEQTEIALFWVESSPLAWNRIARNISARRGLDLWENARLFGLLNLAMADGYIGSWEAKYLYNFWRPITAIQMADTDSNPGTAVDLAWTPLLTTPPIPGLPIGRPEWARATARRHLPMAAVHVRKRPHVHFRLV